MKQLGTAAGGACVAVAFTPPSAQPRRRQRPCCDIAVVAGGGAPAPHLHVPASHGGVAQGHTRKVLQPRHTHTHPHNTHTARTDEG